MESQIKANAELVIKQLGTLSGIEFGYNIESVAWVDSFIEHQRNCSDQNIIDGLINTLGSYLGECIIKCYGGYWQNINGAWCVCFDEKNMAFPFTKVNKQFTNGQEDSIKSFFELIPVMFKQFQRESDQIPIPDDLKRLEFLICQAEAAYSSIYDIPSSSGRAGAFSDCKESMADAINLARQLRLEQKVIELEKKLEHYKNVFHHQMS